MIIDERKINDILDRNQHIDERCVRDILAKALELKGLNLEEVAALSLITKEDLLQELFYIAGKVKDKIYGKRVVLFAPLYISNHCTNECLYCAFRSKNSDLKRRTLTLQEIAQETKCLIDQGQKRILMLAGEVYTPEKFQYYLDAIASIYATKSPCGEIRRINVNLAPLSTEDFRKLKQASIGTYQLFQETYHPATYKEMHVGGKKVDYDWRVTAMDRAMEAGIDDVGIGVLFGLANWRFEILALMQHIMHLEQHFGVGPHTISVPRLEPALGSHFASSPKAPVSDDDFCKIIAILRLAVPYTGMILTTRETAALRKKLLSLGISQISAGSSTEPGGYSERGDQISSAQFTLGDHRTLDEVVRDVVSLGFLPSFCTACYRSSRTGEAFMEKAKTGAIKNICTPNALISFKEYLENYASSETKFLGEQLINETLATLPDEQKMHTIKNMLAKIKKGSCDVFI